MGLTKTLKKGQNRQKCNVSRMVTMVTENIFSFDPNSHRPVGHFGVLHHHIPASINASVTQKTLKKVKIVKM